MVGRLVKQQQVRALPNNHAQHQTGFFSATHAAHGLLDHVATKIEHAQKTTQVLLAGVLAADFSGSRYLFNKANHVLQRVVVRAQHVQLLLGKVANVQALAFSHVATDRGQCACHCFYQC